MILADTSAWIEFDRATGSAVDQRLAELISTDAPLVVTEPVLMEMLAGASNDVREQDLRRLLLSLALSPSMRSATSNPQRGSIAGVVSQA